MVSHRGTGLLRHVTLAVVLGAAILPDVMARGWVPDRHVWVGTAFSLAGYTTLVTTSTPAGLAAAGGCLAIGWAATTGVACYRKIRKEWAAGQHHTLKKFAGLGMVRAGVQQIRLPWNATAEDRAWQFMRSTVTAPVYFSNVRFAPGVGTLYIGGAEDAPWFKMAQMLGNLPPIVIVASGGGSLSALMSYGMGTLEAHVADVTNPASVIGGRGLPAAMGYETIRGASGGLCFAVCLGHKIIQEDPSLWNCRAAYVGCRSTARWLQTGFDLSHRHNVTVAQGLVYAVPDLAIEGLQDILSSLALPKRTGPIAGIIFPAAAMVAPAVAGLAAIGAEPAGEAIEAALEPPGAPVTGSLAIPMYMDLPGAVARTLSRIDLTELADDERATDTVWHP